MLSRSEFLRSSLKLAFGKIAQVVEEKLPEKVVATSKAIFPPGSVANFSEKCTVCGECVVVCPVSAIQVSFDKFYGKNLPQIFPAQKACVMCEELFCIKSCKDEALILAETFPQIGLAEIQKDVCLAYNESFCWVCYDACPLKQSAIKLQNNKPIIIEENCTGCGICEEFCVLEKEKGVVIKV
ncbi:4Fe-4S binding protein [bacterium]|nr:4Fe-4S binding protein [bacterium]